MTKNSSTGLELTGILDELDAERYDPKKFFQEWMCFRDYKLKLGSHEYKQLSLEALCFLWCIQNPIIKSTKTREVNDIDMMIFLYASQCPDFNPQDMNNIVMNAKLWFISTGISIPEATNAVNILVTLAFQPLEMFPPSPEQQLVGEKEIRFDSDWCASMISTVHLASGLLPNEILKMSVAACGWYYIQWCKQQGVKNIGRKSTAEVIYEMDIRCNEMIVDRLIEKDIIKPEERDYYLECLKSPSKRRKDFTVKKS